MLKIANIKKYGPAIIVTVCLVFLSAIIYARNQNKSSEMILFYSESCPHCQNVDEYIKTNKINEKIKFQKLEVSLNKDNSQLLLKKAKSCNLPTTQAIGVPFFFDGQTCFIGDIDIIAYFSKLK